MAHRNPGGCHSYNITESSGLGLNVSINIQVCLKKKKDEFQTNDRPIKHDEMSVHHVVAERGRQWKVHDRLNKG